MDLRTLKDTPPWDWPEGTGKALLDILRDDTATESDLLLASELAGDFTVINDELADALISVLQSADRFEKIRGQAAISLGPVLEQGHTPRVSRTPMTFQLPNAPFAGSKSRCTGFIWTVTFPRTYGAESWRRQRARSSQRPPA